MLFLGGSYAEKGDKRKLMVSSGWLCVCGSTSVGINMHLFGWLAVRDHRE